jgi:hypothetical protein
MRTCNRCGDRGEERSDADIEKKEDDDEEDRGATAAERRSCGSRSKASEEGDAAAAPDIHDTGDAEGKCVHGCRGDSDAGGDTVAERGDGCHDARMRRVGVERGGGALGEGVSMSSRGDSDARLSVSSLSSSSRSARVSRRSLLRRLSVESTVTGVAVRGEEPDEARLLRVLPLLLLLSPGKGEGKWRCGDLGGVNASDDGLYTTAAATEGTGSGGVDSSD